MGSNYFLRIETQKVITFIALNICNVMYISNLGTYVIIIIIINPLLPLVE